MLIGSLRERITIEAPTFSTDANSNAKKITGWSTHAAVYAERNPMEGQAAFEGKEEISKAKVTFKTRLVTGITPAMRVVTRYGETLYITATTPMHAEAAMLITTEIRNNQQ